MHISCFIQFYFSNKTCAAQKLASARNIYFNTINYLIPVTRYKNLEHRHGRQCLLCTYIEAGGAKFVSLFTCPCWGCLTTNSQIPGWPTHSLKGSPQRSKLQRFPETRISCTNLIINFTEDYSSAPSVKKYKNV